MSLLKKVEGFISKKISVGVAGVGAAVVLENDASIYLAITYIVVQGIVDGIGAWNGGR